MASRAELEHRAKSGNVTAQLRLGDLFYQGKGGVEKDAHAAYGWYLRAAEAGSAEAQSNVGYFLESGEAGRIDIKEALSWYERAAGQGQGQGQGLFAVNSVERLRKAMLRAPSGPVPRTGAHQQRRILKLADEIGLGSRKKELGHLLVDSIRLTPRACDESELPIGASKLGGAPDLPPSTVWPSCPRRPLTFLGQINVRDVSKFDQSKLLPSRGLLSFFYDSIDQPWGGAEVESQAWRVLYTKAPPKSLRRTEAPMTLVPTQKWHRVRFTPCGLDFHRELTLPFIRTSQARSLELAGADRERYVDLCDRLNALRASLPNAAKHRLLGWPDAIQGDMQRRIEYLKRGLQKWIEKPDAKLDRAARQWELLLQLDTDRVTHMSWGGNLGMIYFWIRRSDLANERFERTWLQFQTS